MRGVFKLFGLACVILLCFTTFRALQDKGPLTTSMFLDGLTYLDYDFDSTMSGFNDLTASFHKLEEAVTKPDFPTFESTGNSFLDAIKATTRFMTFCTSFIGNAIKSLFNLLVCFGLLIYDVVKDIVMLFASIFRLLGYLLGLDVPISSV